MPISRHFLGYDEPLVHGVCRFLLPDRIVSAPDMDDMLLIVPTRRAGRRVLQRLASLCDREGTGVFPPAVCLPTDLLRRDQPSLAPRAVALAAWMHVLRNVDLARHKALFPNRPPEQGPSWALRTADVLQQVRFDLAEGGFLVGHMADALGEKLPEPARWRDLASLEASYLSTLAKAGLIDPCEGMLRSADAPVLPAPARRVVVAAVPDLSPLVEGALRRLGETCPVEILVHAPGEFADTIDAWGRPLPGAWNGRTIDISDIRQSIRLAANEAAQADEVVQLLDRTDPGVSVAVGVPDPRILSPLRDALERSGYAPFDPSARAFRDHALFHLADAWHALLQRQDYPSLSRVLRHPDFIRYLEGQAVCGGSMLAELDELQNRHLPTSLDDVKRHEAFHRKSGRGSRYPELAKALDLLCLQLGRFKKDFRASSMREFLREIYVRCDAPEAGAGDLLFEDAADLMLSGLDELADAERANLVRPGGEGGGLLIHCMQDVELFSRRADEDLVLDGWLEVPWSDASRLILVGMNDEVVPSGFRGDPFLPDSLRRSMGLKHSEERLARDAFLLSGLLASRPEPGRVTFVYGKATRSGDPLRPSRLLLRCGEKELPERASHLFREARVARVDVPPSVSFPLMVPAVLETEIREIHVTNFAAYLRCPFRYYLSRVLRMKEVDDRKMELDALEFGSLVHDALEKLGRSEELRCSEDPDAVGDFLVESAERLVYGTYGSRPALSVEIQLQSAVERLRKAAEIHVSELRMGWEILDVERRVQGTIESFNVVGKIDRIDRHRETGIVRVLDYKSSDTAEPPGKAHIGGRDPDAPPYASVTAGNGQGTWRSLQLPLYRILLEQEGFSESIGIGYFNLPKAVSHTGVSLWEEFDPKLLDRAQHCAAGILRDISGGRFWPPRSSVRYDEFERLFPAGYNVCVAEASRKHLAAGKGGDAV